MHANITLRPSMRFRHLQLLVISVLLSLQLIQFLRYIRQEEIVCQPLVSTSLKNPKMFDGATMSRIKDILRRNHNRLLKISDLRSKNLSMSVDGEIPDYDSEFLKSIGELSPLLERISEPISPRGPTVYVVTPTVRRPQRKAELQRLAQTLMNLDFIFWIVVEDAKRPYPSIAAMLERTAVPHLYLAATAPPAYKHRKYIGRGVFNRRAALEWLRKRKKKGVVYFADDDNTYHVDLFREVQKTKRVSVFPVGMIQGFGLSSPIVRDHRVIAFHDSFQAGRQFALDMAGFAVNLRVIHSRPNATIPTRVAFLEDGFLKSLGASLDDLEPLASECTEVLVWHTQSRATVFPNLSHIDAAHNDTNLLRLYRTVLE